MASMISHPIVPLALGIGLGQELVSMRLLYAACAVSVVPDFDVIAFKFGISYASDYGHRGFTHSITFAVFVGILGAVCHRWLDGSRLAGFSLLSSATMSHGLLDALTNGGLGIAFFWPLDSGRYFFPWQPLEVSPLGVSRFLSYRGLEVIKSELLWVWLPSLVVGVLIYTGRCRLRHTGQVMSKN